MADHEEPCGLRSTLEASGAFLFILAIGVFGLLIAYYLWWQDWRLSREAPDWPRTNGIVVESRLKTSLGDELSRKYARIAYTYTVGTHRYRHGVSSPLWPFANAGEIARRHPIGTSVTIYYDPEDPGRSVPESWLSWSHLGSWFWLVVAVFPLGFAALVIADFIRRGLSGALRIDQTLGFAIAVLLSMLGVVLWKVW